jgi:hypothetical protein
MFRSVSSVLAAGLALALFGSGCPIWLEGEHGGGVCIGEHCPCDAHTDCDPGYYCWEGSCVYGGDCYYWSCPTGYVCDSRWTCVPEDTVTCDEDADCPAGYCDLAEGVCVNTGGCRPGVDTDCALYGPTFVCDDRGLCVPDRGPCPDGTCGCANDDECSGGWVCRQGLCRDPAEVCTLTTECPGGTACFESFCHVAGCPGIECPATQVCADGTCLDDPDGGGECVYSADCSGGAYCVNGYCVVTCGGDGACGAFESCQSGLCLPEMRRNAY